MSQIAPDPTHPEDAEARLRRSEELLRSAQQLARVGSWEWEVGSETVTWSDELYRIFGRDPAGGPVVYAEYLGYLHPDDRAMLGAAIERAIRQGEAFELEHRLVRSDGSIRWVLGRGGRIAGADGRTARLIGTAQDVTDRREAEETRRRLAEAEAARAQAEAILDSIGELFIACDREWRCTYVNARAQRYLTEIGLTREAVVGQRIWDALPLLSHSPFHQASLQAIREQRVVEVEAPYEPVNRWFAARIVPNADGAVCYARDVTERKRAEAAARQSHDLLQAVFEGTGDKVYVKDTAGRYLLVNRALAEAIGRPVEEIIGRRDDELFDERTAATLVENDRRVLAHGETLTFEEPITGPGFSRVNLSTKGVLRDADGAATGVVGISRDITARSRAEAALRRWGRIFEHAGWGVLIGSADGQSIEAVNPAFARMHGYGLEELNGRPVAALLAPETRDALAEQYGTALRLGRHAFETTHLRRDGTVFPVRVDIAPVRSDDGAVEHWAFNVQDVTAQRRAEEQLRQAQKMEAVGRLAGGLAHDFNNMLMIIIGFGDLLYASLDAADPRQADADEIRKAAERASALTQQLLAFGRDHLLPSRPLDLNGVIRGVEAMLRPVLGEHIEVARGLDAQLAPVQGDRGQLEQVLMNLALNARDAMPRGGRLTIETANVEFASGYAYRTFGIDLPAGPYVMLVVSDTGVGMDADTRAHIFEPFFTTKHGGNSGLGLATVYAIVTRNGGYIWVDSEPGRGTTFTICFPPGGVVTAEAEEVPRSAVRGGSETVLVVEDEQAVRQLACRVLREQGYHVLQAGNGREALDVLSATDGDVHLVVSDVVMPAMNGRELAAHLEQLRPTLPLLFMSGYTDGEIVQLGVEVGARNFLPKPFAPEALVTRVREVLDSVPARGGR